MEQRLLVLFWSVAVVVVMILTKPTDLKLTRCPTPSSRTLATLPSMSLAPIAPLILAAAPELLPVRIVAGIALVAVIVAFVHVLRHLKRIERTIVKDDLVPTERGPRDNVLVMVCAIPIMVVALLFYLVRKA